MKISYETHYKSKREDGRHTSTMAAFMDRLRKTERLLKYPECADLEDFQIWKNSLKEKILELMNMPEFTEQPSPKMLGAVQRDGYRTEKWEFYPDSYTAVPFLILIPDTASKQNPAPGVLCLPGSIHSKEFISGEPLLDMPKCSFQKFPERNRMAKYMVQNGMVAFAFDNPETAECAVDIERDDDWGYTSRTELCGGLLSEGLSYFALSFFQKLCFMKWIDCFEYVDKSRMAVSAHSLGCDDAMYLGLFCDEIKAIVFNDFVCDERHRYFSVTEYDERQMRNADGNWHIIPGQLRYYNRVDVLCALAPKYLALNEGGPEYNLDFIRRAYKLNKASDKLQITHYPKYQDEEARCKQYEPPMYGLSFEDHLIYSNVDVTDHSFREAPSINLLKKALF